MLGIISWSDSPGDAPEGFEGLVDELCFLLRFFGGHFHDGFLHGAHGGGGEGGGQVVEGAAVCQLAHGLGDGAALGADAFAGGGGDFGGEVQEDGDFALGGLFHGPAEVFGPDVLDAFAEAGGLREVAMDSGVGFGFEFEVELVEEVFFGGEIGEDGAFGEVCGFGDFGGGGTEAGFGDLGDCGCEDRLALLGTLESGHTNDANARAVLLLL